MVALREAGREIRHMMREAREAGARLVHFTEGATCAPNKRIMSTLRSQKVGPSNWSLCEWASLREELNAIRTLAGELGVWVVLGSVHELTSPRRPHNSLYVISDRGILVTRYDERMLSNTKVSYMYTPGAGPVTFDVDGVRFGCALGMESHFPEIFVEYDRLDVDCVLLSTTGGAADDGSVFSTQAQGHAATNSYWVSFSIPAQCSSSVTSGIIAPGGAWATRCEDHAASFTVTEVGNDSRGFERPWRRIARSGIYRDRLAQHDRRSVDRTTF